MRDGVVLRATVLKPGGPGPFPVLVYRTPYGQASAVTGSTTFTAAVARGYAVVAQDVRGRYLSDGEFHPYRQEGADGYDTIEWAARQPWSTGAVGSFGLSYPGAVQWLAAVEAPPHLKAMVPAMTFSRPTNFWYAGGTADLSWPAWIWLNIGPDVRQRKNLPGPRTTREARTTWASLKDQLPLRLPIVNLPEFEAIAPWLFEWYRHPPDDPWWDWADLTNKYSRVGAAVLNVSAWHDDNYGPEGALTNHRGLLAARAGQVDPKTFLILGPWVHGVGGMNDRTSQSKSGERVFGAKAGIAYDEEILHFMDRYVRGIENGAERAPRFRVFVMGENEWRTADAWPLPGTAPTRLHLTAKGTLAWSPPDQTGQRTITSDPARPIHDPFGDRAGAHDYRALSNRSDLLVYETAPLDRDLRVVGNIEARLTFETDAPSIDVWVKLLDVAPDGTAWNVMSAGLDVARVDRPNRPHEVVLDNLLTGNLFRRGHRIRIVVMNSFLPNFGRNPQTGRSEVVETTTRPARFTLLHGAGRPSFLTLPVIP
ncbi:MAG: CocE/NonD family hydrolase [Gemmatimonadales bacterium]